MRETSCEELIKKDSKAVDIVSDCERCIFLAYRQTGQLRR
jgi:hypothetical protein